MPLPSATRGCELGAHDIGLHEPLFERKPSAAAKLGDLRPGQFVVVQDATIAEIERTPSLLIAEPVPEDEIRVPHPHHRVE